MGKGALSLILGFALALPVAAQEAGPRADLRQRVAAALARAGPGTRFGLLVADDQGRAVIAIDPDQRFIPASNTKIFTTAAAWATLPDMTGPDTAGGAAVRLEGRDVVLVGNGDARLSSADDCAVDCLATLVDAVAAKTRVVHDVIGDDTLFPDERWSPGMSWDDIQTRYGTGTSALTLDDNTLAVTVTPGAGGAAPTVALPAYYTVDDRVTTVAGTTSDIGFRRAPDGYVLRLTGTIGAGAGPARLRVGIDDPARYAAWRFAAMLRARGVRVTGTIAVRHRSPMPADDPAVRGAAPPARPPAEPVLAKLTPPPLADDVRITNKLSQNLHADLLLRRVALVAGSGSIADGGAAVRRVLALAGVPRAAFDFSDGSGMSVYNRVTPRATVTVLRWIAAQPWGAAWRETLPVGGVDGTLARRFAGTILDRKLFAKTGSLTGATALAGYVTAASGHTLTFTVYANDMPAGAGARATQAIDAALVLIAQDN